MSCCSCSTVFFCLVWLALHVFVRSFEHLILIAFFAHGFQSIVSSNIFILILVLPCFVLPTHCCRRPGCATKPRMGSLRHSQVMPGTLFTKCYILIISQAGAAHSALPPPAGHGPDHGPRARQAHRPVHGQGRLSAAGAGRGLIPLLVLRAARCLVHLVRPPPEACCPRLVCAAASRAASEGTTAAGWPAALGGFVLDGIAVRGREVHGFIVWCAVDS